MITQVASRYTKALLQLALESRVLERIYQDMTCIAQVCSTHPSLLEILRSPVVSHAKKLEVLRSIFQHELHSLTRSFLALIIQKRRAALILAMAQNFLTQYYQYQDIKKAQVITTFPLSDQLAIHVQAIVQKIAPCKQVVLEQHIDPDLIGGYILQVEGKQLDQSLKTKLLKLKKKYITGGY